MCWYLNVSSAVRIWFNCTIKRKVSEFVCFNCKEHFLKSNITDGWTFDRQISRILSVFQARAGSTDRTGYMSDTRQRISQQYGSLLVTLVLKRRSDANTCRKCLPDGVNEDSDYIFRGGQEWESEQRERRKKMESQFNKEENKTKPRQCVKRVHNWVKNQKNMSQHDSLRVSRQLFSSGRMRGWIPPFLPHFVFL